jgi:predicted dehydrogenase
MMHLATIGAGRWGFNWVRTLAHLPGVQLRWCADLSADCLARVRDAFPHVRTTTRPRDLFEDPDVQGVVIATSAPTHFEVARQALAAGKHVLVEKPMTLSSRHAFVLDDMARRQGRVLMVGHLLEYHPIIRRIKDMLDSGELGELHYVYSQRLNLGTIRSDENAWWSLAAHDVPVACRLFGDFPVSVQCRGQCIIDPKIEDVVHATLTFPGGRLAQIHVSWLDPHKTRKLTVVGSRRSVVFDDTSEPKLLVFDKGVDRSPTGAIALRSGATTAPDYDTTEPLKLEAQHFVECIRNGVRPLSDGESGMIAVSVLEYGQRSLERGGKVVAINAARLAWNAHDRHESTTAPALPAPRRGSKASAA